MNKITKAYKESEEIVLNFKYWWEGHPYTDPDRQEIMNYLRKILSKALTQYHQDLISEVVEKLEKLHRNSEARSAELECSQEGYEYGIEEAQTIIKNLTRE